MIDLAVAAIARKLNESLQRSFGLREDVVALSHIVEQDGRIGTQAENRIVMMLVNVERETAARRAPRAVRDPLGPSVLMPEPVFLVLTVLFAANFDGAHYDEALKMLGATVGVFQRQHVLDQHNTPGLDRRLDRLVLDMVSLGISELSELWSILGGKYLSSVLYRVRLVPVDLGQVSGQNIPVVNPAVGVGV